MEVIGKMIVVVIAPEALQTLDAQIRRAAEDEYPKEEHVDHFREARGHLHGDRKAIR